MNERGISMNKTLRKGVSLMMTVLLNLGVLAGVAGDSGLEPAPGQEGWILPGVTDGTGEETGAPERTGMELPDKLAPVTEAVSDASLTLFQKLTAADIGDGENVMISPVSILSALALAEAGAGGETLKEMEKAFGCSREDLQAWMKAWKDSLKTGETTRLNVASSFWYRENFTPNEKYLKAIKTGFDAEAYPSQFNDETVAAINRWCKENTYDMIPKILDQLSEEQVALLLNAVAFEGKWETPYEDHQVRKETFTAAGGGKQKATMLYSTEKTYIHDEKVSGFIKPYRDGYSFVAILPEKGVSVADYMKGLDGKAFRNLLASSEKAEVYAKIPEFQSEYSADGLVDVLQNMGVRQAFDDGKADFSAMGSCESGKLYISDILHKTFIELNREGTRAAAVTGIICGTTSVQPPEKTYEVYLDRPFLYAIIDDDTQTPMFIGAVMNLE